MRPANPRSLVAPARAARLLLATAAIVAVAGSPIAEVRASETYEASVANGGDADATTESSASVESITTGLNVGHAVAVGDTADGSVTINVGEVRNEARNDVSAGNDTLLTADASGGDNSRLPGKAVGDVEISPNIRSDSDSNASAEGGEGGAGGYGEGGEGGAGGDGGTGGSS